ncbi:MAG: sensor histidine kinase [Usitatibacter sp.]
MRKTLPTLAPFGREHFHPLELIPFFRRFPASFGRDFLYTFIWSGLIGAVFYVLNAMGAERLPSLRVFGLYILISSVIGYSIHALFAAGSIVGLDARVRCGGFVTKVAYFSLIPLMGVLFGFWVVSHVIDLGFGDWLTQPAALISITTTSLVISTIMGAIFFWRERHARAEAETERQRLRAERVERDAALANLRALQAQIEPHFLFNTLANVTSLIDPDPAKARRMLESFIRFLRASLGATRAESTTLADEAELIAAYLDVLEIRMGKRLRYEIEVPPGLHAFELPPMLLQPIVENAIRHGLEPKVEGGRVSVRAHRDGEAVVIEVTDDGVGFAPTTRGGVGLTNLRDRLRLLYGERAALVVGESAAGGASVAMRLPA